ncbi:MAG: NRDE family protein [Cellvibrionaceae bacterium]
MCLILFSVDSHPHLPLVIAANRDEYYFRPTSTAKFWKDNPQMLAGKDLEAGGSWMGVTRGGRFAAITNFRSPTNHKHNNFLSRGQLVRDFLSHTNKIPATSFAEHAINDGKHYAGFNLLLKDENDFVYCNNQTNDTQILTPGTYALSNHLLNTPWPKVTIGKKSLRTLLDDTPTHMSKGDMPVLADSLFSILQNKEPATEEDLPTTGIDKKTEQLLSSLFIESEHYGTCSSTTIIFDKENNIYFHEKNYYTEKHKISHREALSKFTENGHIKNKQLQSKASKDNIFYL